MATSAISPASRAIAGRSTPSPSSIRGTGGQPMLDAAGVVLALELHGRPSSRPPTTVRYSRTAVSGLA